MVTNGFIEHPVVGVLRAAGPADILVNNAAVSWLAPVADFTDKRFRLMFEIQVRAPFELAQLVLPGMRARRQGWILNLTSRAAVHPEGPPYGGLYRKGGFTVYGMCKAALDRLTTGLAAEVYGDGIAVNALAPWDPVATPGTTNHDLTGAALESPDLTARSAVVLCSTPPSELTGRVLFTKPFLAEWDGRRAPPANTGITTLRQDCDEPRQRRTSF